MLIIPAIDLREGRCVRLYQGRPEEETVFSEDPVAVARSWEELGAPMLHVVDLDGAFAGTPRNLDVVRAIVDSVSIPVQLGGGIRTLESIRQALELGVNRVILGTVAISDPRLVAEACRRHGAQVLVGIDSKGGKVAVEGWAATVEKTALDLAKEMRHLGIQRVVYTDTRRDGTMAGPNLQATREVAESSGLRVIASGGMSSLEDVRAVASLEPSGVEGVILGKALYTGAISLPEALGIARGGQEG
ncbi:1-(5-phosphoribosyl)-5-[(5-phosphoribosylamino)methylideneamino] imidazole-4-carboxamide isomerase [Clostridiales bacterium PH28_bin88]|nr:1-(5-phosphoribosyl)-5-[(5-phosphoribosylamino)methylideneamino] imidazole-4-carboxamide isomerase [Clostridiales bacterium PH28_bin88]